MPSIGQTTQLASGDPLQGMASVLLPVVVLIGVIAAAYVLLPKVRATKFGPQKLLAVAAVVSLGVGVSFHILPSFAGLGQVTLFGWLLTVVGVSFGVAARMYGVDKPEA